MNNSASIFLHCGNTHLDFLKEAYVFLILAYEDLKSQKYDSHGKNENNIRDELVKIAEKNETIFQWVYESPNVQSGNVRIDIELITPLSLLSGSKKERIAIECKIVGEDEYINRNGISSFVSNKYASNMPLAGMIGFIKDGNISEKIGKIKELLDKHPDIITHQNLQFYEFNTGFSESYESRHKRSDRNAITIYHLFFDFCV